MEDDLRITSKTTIPGHELEITASRSGGPGGQHVNTSSTRILLRWNIVSSSALTEDQKKIVLEKLQSRVTLSGDLLLTSGESRSQHANKERVLKRLVDIMRKALYVPKKRMATRISLASKHARLHAKAVRSGIKKMRNKNIHED